MGLPPSPTSALLTQDSRGGYGPLKDSFSKTQTQTQSRGDPTVFSFGVMLAGDDR